MFKQIWEKQKRKTKNIFDSNPNILFMIWFLSLSKIAFTVAGNLLVHIFRSFK